MGKTRRHHVYTYIYTQSSPLRLQLFHYRSISLFGLSGALFEASRVTSMSGARVHSILHWNST